MGKRSTKNIRFTIFIIIIVLIQQIASVGQTVDYNSNKLYSMSELRADILFLKRAYMETHPALYHYISEKQLDSLFDETLNSIQEPLSYNEFYKRITPLVTNVRSGHTEISFSDSYNKYVKNEQKKIPVDVKCVKNKLYLFKNFSSNENLKVGYEISKINNVASNEMLSVLLPVFSVDGYIPTVSPYILNLQFRNLFALYFGEYDRFEIELIDGEVKEKVLITALDEDSINYYKAKRYPITKKEPYSLTVDHKKQTAVLTLSTFVLPENYNIYKFIDSSFAAIEKAKVNHLIIDLRNNTGGNGEYNLHVFSYLTDKEFVADERLETVINKPPFYNANLYIGDSNWYHKQPSGRYRIYNYPVLLKQKPQKKTFKGRVYVVMNGFTLSAGASLCGLIHAYQRGVFIGEESGSDYYQIEGYQMPCALPNTQIKIWIPLQTYFRNSNIKGYQPGRGVMPDYPIVLGIDDYMKDKDRTMDFVFQLINPSK